MRPLHVPLGELDPWAARCVSCGRRLTASYITVEGVEGRFCPECYRDYPHCSACGAPIGEQGHVLGDRRPLCERCERTAIRPHCAGRLSPD